MEKAVERPRNQRGRRRARALTSVAVAVCSLMGVSAGGVTAPGPVVTVTEPSSYQSVLPSAPMTISGTASDALGIASVTLKAKDRNSGFTTVFSTTLTQPGQPTTGWSAAWAAPRTGSYRLIAVARNTAGTAAAQTVVFDVAGPSGPGFLPGTTGSVWRSFSVPGRRQ